METQTLTRASAHQTALKLLRAKLVKRPEMVSAEGDTVKAIALGLRKIFERHGFTVDEDAAEGIAEAMQELLPGARDEASSASALEYQPHIALPRRSRLWRPS